MVTHDYLGALGNLSDKSYEAADIAHILLTQLVENVIFASLFGFFFACAIISMVVVARKACENRVTTVLQILAIASMFTSTTLLWAINLYNFVVDAKATVALVADVSAVLLCLFHRRKSEAACYAYLTRIPLPSTKANLTLRECVGPAALTINLVLGDAIVWWRVCVVWPHNRVVRRLGFILIIAAFVSGIVTTVRSCEPRTFHPKSPGIVDWFGTKTQMRGSFFTGDVFGIIASALSLTTNLVATSMIGYKAWKRRSFIRQPFANFSSGRSQLAQILALLIESGIVYCIIWTFIVAFQLSVIRHGSSKERPESVSVRRLLFGLQSFLRGGLVTIIAVYPTIVIIVALNKSEAGFRHERISSLEPKLRRRPTFAQKLDLKNMWDRSFGRSAVRTAQSGEILAPPSPVLVIDRR